MVGPISGKVRRVAVAITGICTAAMMISCAASTVPKAPSQNSAIVPQSWQRLSKLEVERQGDETVVTLVGPESPVYSAYRLEDGHGLAVELTGVEVASSEAGWNGPLGVYDGLVEQVSASTFAGGDEPLTRVEMALGTDAQWEVVPVSGGLSVRIRARLDDDGEASAAEIASLPPESELSNEATPDAELAGEQAATPPITAQEATGGEALQAAPAEVELKGEQTMPVAVSAEPASTLLDIVVTTTENGVLVRLKADGAIAAVESFTIENPDRLVIDLPGLGSEISRYKMPVGDARIAQIRVGVHPDKIRVVLDGAEEAKGFEGRRVIPAADGLLVAVGTGDGLDQAVSAGLRELNEPVPTSSMARVDDADEGADSSAMDSSAMDGAPAAAFEDEISVEGEQAAATPEEGASVVEPALIEQGGELVQAGVLEDVEQEADQATLAVEAGEPVESAQSVETAEAAQPVEADELDVSEAVGVEPGPTSAHVYGVEYDSNSARDRLAVLSDEVVDYEVLTPDAETIVLRMKNATIDDEAADRITPRPGGPISLISTFQQPDVERDEVRVVVKRAADLEPQVTRHGSLIFLDFENTGVAAAPPPAFIPGDEMAADGNAHRTISEGTDAAESADEQVATTELTPDVETPVNQPLAAVESLQDLPADANDYAALPGTEPIGTRSSEDAALVAVGETSSAPASLDPPAAVDVLEEGGLIDGKEYKGRRISLDFKDVEIADVLRLIAEVSDLNIIAGDEVAGVITIRLVDVPWDQALDVILLTKGLGFVRVGNVLRIAPSEVLKAEEEVRLQERRNKEKLEDLEVKLQPVNYASVKDVSKLVKRLLSPRGSVNVDERTNTVIIKDISSVIDEATALIQALDTQTPQVMIEAKVVEANLEFSRELGSIWSVGTQPLVDGFDSSSATRTDLGNENFKWKGANNVSFGNPITSTATGVMNFGAFLLNEKMQVDVQIQAAEANGNGKVISSPRVVTLDNREAVIEQGVSIPFQTFESGDAKLEFIDAVLSLKVTPHITTDKSIIMKLEVTRNAPDASVSTPTGSPAIAKNQAKTETLVKNGQTLVIGGIYTIDKTERSTRVPYLSKIPVLGAMFKSKELSDLRKELLIFVTPRIVVTPELVQN